MNNQIILKDIPQQNQKIRSLFPRPEEIDPGYDLGLMSLVSEEKPTVDSLSKSGKKPPYLIKNKEGEYFCFGVLENGDYQCISLGITPSELSEINFEEANEIYVSPIENNKEIFEYLKKGRIHISDPTQLYSDHLPVMFDVPVPNEKKLRIISWNILDSRNPSGYSEMRGNWESPEENQKRYQRIVNSLKNFIQKQNPHVIVLQEANSTILDPLLSQLEGWTFQEDTSGCKILYRTEGEFKPVENSYLYKDSVKHGEIVMNTCQSQLFNYGKQQVRIRNVHSAFFHSPQHHEELYREWITKEDKNIIPVVCGDTNTHVAPERKDLQSIATGLVPLCPDFNLKGKIIGDFPDAAFTRNSENGVTQVERMILNPYPEGKGEVFDVKHEIIDLSKDEEPRIFLMSQIPEKIEENKIVLIKHNYTISLMSEMPKEIEANKIILIKQDNKVTAHFLQNKKITSTEPLVLKESEKKQLQFPESKDKSVELQKNDNKQLFEKILLNSGCPSVTVACWNRQNVKNTSGTMILNENEKKSLPSLEGDLKDKNSFVEFKKTDNKHLFDKISAFCHFTQDRHKLLACVSDSSRQENTALFDIEKALKIYYQNGSIIIRPTSDHNNARSIGFQCIEKTDLDEIMKQYIENDNDFERNCKQHETDLNKPHYAIYTTSNAEKGRALLNFLKNITLPLDLSGKDISNCIKDKNFGFVRFFKFVQQCPALKNKISNYRNAQLELCGSLRKSQTTEERSIKIYNFFKANRDTLIEIEKLSLQQRLKFSGTKNTLYQEFDQIYQSSGILLKNARRFCQWHETNNSEKNDIQPHEKIEENIIENKVENDIENKVNPGKLLGCLSAINNYLKTRASKTSGFLSTLFNSYSGKDYYFRRDSFCEILKILKEGKISDAIKRIDEDYIKVNKGFFSKNQYAGHLDSLKKALNEFVESKAQLQKAVCEKIESYHGLYEKMAAYTETVKAYNNSYKFFQPNLELAEKIVSAKIDYRETRRAMSKEMKVEFHKDKDLHDIEYKNVNCM